MVGVALKIARPSISMTLLDATKKKLDAVERVLERIGISDISIAQGRAEDLAHDVQYREAFDAALARALAKLPTLVEYCAAFVKVGGRLIAYKSADIGAELAASAGAAGAMGLSGPSIEGLALPSSGAERRLLIYNKDKPTPGAYPRPNNRIAKGPLARR
jgi:16S rRNA (guanine527-N7)-methyltransferase